MKINKHLLISNYGKNEIRKIAVVITTFKREHTNFDYLKKTINQTFQNLNKVTTDFFLYCDAAEWSEIKPIISPYNMKILYSCEFPELKKLPSDSYQYWMLKITLNFVDSMEQAMKQTDSNYLMRLEDDAWVTSGFKKNWKILLRKNKKFQFANAFSNSTHDGSVAVIYGRSELPQFIDYVKQTEIVKKMLSLDYINGNYFRNKPEMIGEFNKISVHHIGFISSRNDELAIRNTSLPISYKTRLVRRVVKVTKSIKVSFLRKLTAVTTGLSRRKV